VKKIPPEFKNTGYYSTVKTKVKQQLQTGHFLENFILRYVRQKIFTTRSDFKQRLATGPTSLAKGEELTILPLE